MEQILLNTTLDKTLAEQGFVVIPFLDTDKVKELSAFFYEHHKEIPGFYASAHSQDIAFRNKMNDKIKAAYKDAIQSTFHNCEALGGSFVVKTNNQKERLHPHQDWNIVDESKHRSFNIWVPLVDLNENNGAIRVLPKSHLWGLNFRGPNIPDKRADQLETFWEKMETLNMKAGEALIYDHRLYHASYPNKTNQFRLATVFGIKPKDAEMFYYYGNGDDIEKYKSSVDFFMNGDIQNGPKVLERVVEEKALDDTKSSNGFLNFIKNLFR